MSRKGRGGVTGKGRGGVAGVGLGGVAGEWLGGVAREGRGWLLHELVGMVLKGGRRRRWGWLPQRNLKTRNIHDLGVWILEVVLADEGLEDVDDLLVLEDGLLAGLRLLLGGQQDHQRGLCASVQLRLLVFFLALFSGGFCADALDLGLDYVLEVLRN